MIFDLLAPPQGPRGQGQKNVPLYAPSDFILPILQPNTGCFPIQNRPVFSQFWRFFPNLRILLGFILKFKRHRLYPQNSNKITGPIHVSNPHTKFGWISSNGRVPTRQGKVREIRFFFKVREKSGNSVKWSGKLENLQKSGKSQGINMFG